MRRPSLVLLVLAVAATGCFRSFNPRQYSTSTALYAAGLARYEAGKWGDAIRAFERLTLDLPARDTLLARSHWYLAQSRLRNGERLLAAQAFLRLAETLPDDTLADDALFRAGRAYAELWRRPALDPQYGTFAETQYRLLLGLYPSSVYADSATAELKRLDEWFATKDYETGEHYRRRKAFDSAILYYQDVVKNHPETDKARQAMLRLVEVYRHPALRYTEDADEVCEALRAAYPQDAEVRATCAPPRDATAPGG
jgi:outer membrane protein assembly factor BamD